MHEEMWGRRGGGPRGRGRGPRRGGGWGGPPPEFMRGGPGGFGGPFGGGRGRGPRVRRGDVRAAALSLLAEGPRNGYQIIQEISERTDGVWRPSPGSVYPALQQLEDEQLIQPETGESGRKAFALTDEGRAYTESHADELAASWDAVTGSVDDGEVQLRQLIRQVLMAVSQVSQAGSAAQVKQAGQVLTDTRRSLYRILAADDDEDGSSDSETAEQ
ncbi:MAG TPA: PadR family transcriptional regulator [Streptosporangiaceae bacterium]